MTSSVCLQPRGPVGRSRPDAGSKRRNSSPHTCREPGTGALLTVTGPHRPEVVEQVFAALAGHDGTAPVGELTDVAQAVLHDRLTLVAVVRPAQRGPREEDTLLARLVRLAAELSAATGMDVDVEVADAPSSAAPARAHVMIVGGPVPAGAVAAAIRGIGAAGGWVEAMSATSSDPLTGVELVACGAAPEVLCSQLAWVAAATGTDIAVA
jgi:phosphoserine phosphatase